MVGSIFGKLLTEPGMQAKDAEKTHLQFGWLMSDATSVGWATGVNC